MTVGYKKPHLPLIAPKKYWDLYPEGSVKMPTNYYTPKNAPQIALMTWGELRAYKDIPAEGQVSDEIALNLRRAYYACVSFVDTQIGRLINALKENGMDKNTIVILTSDHGWKIGEHAMWCKHTNYEIDARVPLIIKTPENQTGRIEQSFTELIDVYPTICNLAGIPTPDDCEGKDLSAWLKNANTAPHPYAISQYKRSRKTGGDVIGYSVKNTGFRYTEWINSETKKVVASELYNHNLDPDENTNVVENPEYKSNIEELSKIIHASLK
jgi:iduronate 2-sulfatase